MKKAGYIAAITTIGMSIFALPNIDVVVKGCLFTVVTIISIAINIIFKFQKIREWVARWLSRDLIVEILKDNDIQKLLALSRALEAHKLIEILQTQNQKELKRKKK